MNRSISVRNLLYTAALIFFVVSLPLSLYTMSVASFLLLAIWIGWDWEFQQVKALFRSPAQGKIAIRYLWRTGIQGIKRRSVDFYRNKPALIFSFLFFIHLIWLINTTNFSYALKDIRVALPLLLFPLLFSGLPKIDYRQLRIILLFYLAALVVSSLFSGKILFTNAYSDIRQISPLISPIRLGLNLTFGIFIIMYFIVKDRFFSTIQKFGLLTVALWFLAILFFMESITSLTILLIIGLGLLIYMVFQSKHPLLKIGLGLIFLIIPSSLYLYLNNEIIRDTTPPIIIPGQLDRYTASGNPYTFDTIQRGVEDGKYIGLYLCIPEIKQEWSKRSSMPFSGKDKLGHALSETLIRYLTSKNLRKDAKGIEALTPVDIRRIENGVANYNYVARPGIRSRLLKIITGYEVFQKTGNSSGSSVMQRLVYMKASLKIIKKNFWMGVGTGDVQNAFFREFHEMDSQLKHQFMFLSHNQFLESFVTYGIFGFLIFIIALFYPPLVLQSSRNYFFEVFFAIMLLSMLSDTTLDTHAGVSLFAFFSSLFLFGTEYKTN